MLHQMKAVDTINPLSEMHYRFHQRIDPSIYPQVHDFYEFILVTSGAMLIEINHEERTAKTGALVLIRPGDIHSKKRLTDCEHINLAFPARVLSDMFRYLDLSDVENQISQAKSIATVFLKKGELLLLKAKLEKLNLMPINAPHRICVELRRQILDMMLQFIVPSFQETLEENCPHWLSQLLEELENPDMFSSDLKELTEYCGCTKEHLCRSFKKYVGVTPMAYLNAKRLNYAANLLLHSDQKVIDIAFMAGFQSLSRFYHAFREEFKTSPLEYRAQHQVS